MAAPRIALLAAVDTAVLVLLRPDVAALRRGLAEPRRWLADDGADRVLVTVCSAVLWALAAWVAVGLLVTGGSQLPGAAGRAAAAVAAVTVPLALRRLIAGSAGLGVLLAPVAAGTAFAAGPHPPAPTVPRPITATELAATVGGGAGAARGLAEALPAAPLAVPPLDPDPPLPGPRWPDSGEHRTRASAVVTVRPGQCLWSIAEHRLAADGTARPGAVARYVERIHAANRAVIGADPDLVLPGQHLHLPAPDHEDPR